MLWFTGTGPQMQTPGTAENCTKGNSGEEGGTLARWVGALFTKGEETGVGSGLTSVVREERRVRETPCAEVQHTVGYLGLRLRRGLAGWDADTGKMN